MGRFGDYVGIGAVVAGNRQPMIVGGGKDAVDIAGRIAPEDGPIFGDRRGSGRVANRIEIGIGVAAADRVQLFTIHLERNADLDQRQRQPQLRDHAILQRGRQRPGAAGRDRGATPAQRTFEIHQAARGQQRLQRARGFGVDFFPRLGGNRGVLA